MSIRSSALRANTRLTVEALEARDVPASFHINNGDVAGLIAALIISNTDGQSDVIHLAKGGNYTLSAATDTSFGATGLPGILADGELIIQGNGATLQRDPAAPLFRLMLVNGGNLTLNRVTIANGSSDPAFSATDGGGIRVQNGSLTVNNSIVQNNVGAQNGGANGGAIGLRPGTAATITDTTFTNNLAVNGGAINSAGATALTLIGCAFTNNKSLGSGGTFGFAPNGGAVNVDFGSTMTTILDSTFTGNLAATGGALAQIGGRLTIQRSAFTGNRATVGGLGSFGFSFSGGAISLANVQTSITDSTISGNTSQLHGGGINAYSGTATLTNCTVSGNSASFDGGGAMVFAGTMNIVNSTISGNRAGRDGGGVNCYSYYGSGNANIRNSTISGNTAVRNGGGISAATCYFYYAFGSNSVLNNCTVSSNTAADGGGVAHDALGTIAIISTIVAGNHDSDAAATPDLFGDVAADFSLIGNSSGGTVTGANNLVGTAVSPIDPKLGPLANNGGPTKTHALLSGSPAINTGSNPDNLTFDQRGSGFARVVGSAADIGAFEVQNHSGHHDHDRGDGDDSALGGDLDSTVKPTELGIIDGSLIGNRQSLTQFSHDRDANGTGPVSDAFTRTAGVTVVTLNGFTGAHTRFGSLADGRYTLTALASQIIASGVTMTSNYTFVNAQGLFRMFGDVNGDQTVNGLDFGFFKNAFGTATSDPSFLSYFDINGDGVINGFEFGQFRTRFGTMLP